MTPLRFFVAALLMGASSLTPRSADATEGLAWQLDDATVRYFMEAQVFLPQVMWFKAEINKELRVSVFRIQLLTTCSPARVLGSRGWELSCQIDDVSLSAVPVGQAPEEDLPFILEELDGRYLEGEIQLTFNRDGRIRGVDLEGVDKHNPRLIEIQETMRLVLARALATLDLQLPKKGDDKGKGAWKQSESTTLGFPSTLGTQGSARITHEITASDGAIVDIHTTGRGTLGSGETIIINDVERPKDLFDMTIDGTARFDTARGLLLERRYQAEGTPQASAASADGAAGYPYVQSSRLLLIEGDTPVPEIGPNVVIDLEALQGGGEAPSDEPEAP